MKRGLYPQEDSSIKLSAALVLRKHLDARVKQLTPLKMAGDQGAFEIQTKTRQVSDTVQEVTNQLPRITLEELTKEYDKYSKALRQLDTKIQETNWLTEIEFDDTNLAV